MQEQAAQIRNNLFDLGEPNVAYAKYFSGQSYLQSIVAPDDMVDVNISSVSFEPACRNNWHIHHNGYQILIVTAGQGWYQEAGKPAWLLQSGDVVVIKAGVNHWHGATQNSWFTHLAVTKGTSEWLEPVSDSDYAKLHQD
ncbi:cupin domain-containing protein [Ligilactobacillus saerimneri]|uniref:cupin domain-containing protein n=1 Tax=Ligilactobacillus saerimneri TaxID=228229 RepID=UPI002943F2A2|nr:cupin domain-containing protein [Ligilactobacillus saerimneri]